MTTLRGNSHYHFNFSKANALEGRYARGEFTATVLLEHCTKLYGKSILTRSQLWNKPKKARDEINAALELEIEEDDVRDLEAEADRQLQEEALGVDQHREAIVRARNAISHSFRDDLIDWDFDFEDLPPTKDRHDPHQEKVPICWKCRDEMFEELVTSCGCKGYCRTCLEEAQNGDGLCLNTRCKKPFHMFITINNTTLTASREVMELERMSQEQQQLQQLDEEQDEQDDSDSDNSLHTDVDLLSNHDSTTEEEYHTEDDNQQTNGELSDDDFTDLMQGHFITPRLTKAGKPM